MVDMTDTIIPKSDQLNADDLIAGPLTVTITKVARASTAEQPIAVSFDGDGGKPYMPCKSMRRVMVAVWGPDASQYAGRSMTLYRDPEVTWGGMAVGGIRISHMSGMDQPMVMALTATKKARKPYRVLPLVIEPPKPAADAAATVAAELVAFADGIESADAIAEFDANPSITKRRDRLRDVRPELSRDVEAAVMAARARVAPTPAAKVEDDDVPF
jgi:hypothetical protein